MLLLLTGLFVAGCSPTPVEVLSVDGPEELETNEQGTFQAEINEDAETPVEARWDFGDGSTGSGMMTTHAFNSEGEYTVTFTASNEANSASQTLTVNVVPPPVPAQVVTLSANPNPGTEGEPVRFSSSVRGDSPVDYEWDFGDGSTAQSTSPTHVYNEPGAYQVTLNVSNDVGQDSRSISVEIEPALAAICTEVTEFNAAFFSFNSSTLTDEGEQALQENLDIVSQCPNLSVRVEGFAAPGERNAQALSEDRAETVAQFYQDDGIASSRITTSGEGMISGQGTSKKGANSQLRRADSIPMRN
jgi:outer membrane protein OmpA-like peptidoglycan-associated protein